MKTIKCDFCGENETISQIKLIEKYAICGSCTWHGVTVAQIKAVHRQPERIGRNQTERRAHFGF